MKRDWGRFTARGGDKVEARIAGIVEEAGEVVKALTRAEEYRALVLIGGYGRGEGGVEEADGEERPHNNLDFLLLANRERAGMKEEIDRGLQPLRERHGLGIDFSVITTRRLRAAPVLVLWHDMRFGHKTILGEAGYVPSMTRFEADRIVPADARNLMVNRGTLLLINDLVLGGGPMTTDHEKMVIRHAIKCIIGYGDAFLFFLGRYHWSYLEKQRRMRDLEQAPARFRALYDEAMEFRFRTDYPRFLGRDLKAWMEELRDLLAPIHLRCERLRLRDEALSWDWYIETALAAVLTEEMSSPRAWARKILAWRSGPRFPDPRQWRARLGCRCAGWRGVLPVLFPIIAFGAGGERELALAQRMLGAEGSDREALGRAYLDQWGAHCDRNFAHVLRRLAAGRK